MGGGPLILEETHHRLDLLIGDEGAVDAGDAPAAGHVQHVAAAQELLGAGLAQDGAAVDLGWSPGRRPGLESWL